MIKKIIVSILFIIFFTTPVLAKIEYNKDLNKIVMEVSDYKKLILKIQKLEAELNLYKTQLKKERDFWNKMEQEYEDLINYQKTQFSKAIKIAKELEQEKTRYYIKYQQQKITNKILTTALIVVGGIAICK